ncbi:MAG: hypothetical protein KGJ07_00625 [Patescibacteria group bacterium]|nr:hypothetical protein [Patescibacteria group bacterium]
MGAVPFPNYYNATNNANTISANVTNPMNTTTSSPFNWFTQPIQIVQAGTQTMANLIGGIGNFLGGGFIVNALNHSFFGLPSTFISYIQVALGLLIIVEASFYITGRYNFSFS